jgi:hypothetical protein
VAITWNAASGATEYRVLRDGLEVSAWQAALTYDDTTASASCPATHSYTVKSRNSCGESGVSSANNGCVQCPALSVPTGVTATDGAFDDRVRITWATVSGATEYRVLRDGTEIGSWAATTQYDDFAASSECPATHNYTVKARSACAESAQSSADTGCLFVFSFEGEGGVDPDALHSADINLDYKIQLNELLRLIQFFNIGALHCDIAGEDGFAPGAGDQTCTPHDSDYSPQNWVIALTELLRMIQFFNLGGYHCELGSEDGFGPGLSGGVPCGSTKMPWLHSIEGEGYGEGQVEGEL